MQKVYRNPDLFEYQDDAGKPLARVEKGPARKRAVATIELLADTVTHPQYKVGERDAQGKVIKLGEEMEYITWPIHDDDGNMIGESALGWYVFSPYDSPPVKVSRLDPSTGKSVMVDVETAENNIGWSPEGFFATVEDADAKALAIASA